MELWEEDPSNRLHQRTLDTDADSFFDLVFLPDGKTLAGGYVKGSKSGVILWDLVTGKRRKENPTPVPEGQADCVACSPDGKTFAAGFTVFEVITGRGGVVFYDGNTLKPSTEKPLPVSDGPVSSLAFRRDGEILAVGFTGTGGSDAAIGSGGVVLLNTHSGKRESKVLVPQGHVVSVAYSPVDNTIAAGYRTRSGSGVVLLNADTGERRLAEPLLVPVGELRNVAFSPDGQTIAAGYGVSSGVAKPSDGGVLIWNAITGEPLVENPPPMKEGSVNCVVWADPRFPIHLNGHSILAGYGVNTGGGVILWDMSLDSWLLRASEIANRNFSQKEWSHYHPEERYHRTFNELPDGEGVAETKARAELPASTPVR